MRRFLTLLLVLFIFSCSKSSGDDQAPVIVINSPQENATVAADAIIPVSATITDEEEIHEAHLDITNNKNNEVLHFHYHPDVKSFYINEMFTAKAGITYQIKESDDHSGNKSEKEIEILCP